MLYQGCPNTHGRCELVSRCGVQPPFLRKTISHFSKTLLKANMTLQHHVVCNKNASSRTMSRLCTNRILVAGGQMDVGSWAGLFFIANLVSPDLFTLQGMEDKLKTCCQQCKPKAGVRWETDLLSRSGAFPVWLCLTAMPRLWTCNF